MGASGNSTSGSTVQLRCGAVQCSASAGAGADDSAWLTGPRLQKPHGVVEELRNTDGR